MGVFPNVVYLGYGDEKVAQSTRIGGYPLGQLATLPDGRTFRHAQAGSAAALSAGAFVSTTASVVGHGGVSGSGLLASATATENLSTHTTVYLTSKSVAITVDQYADGSLNVLGPAGSAYIGHIHKIKSNESAAVSSKVKFVLEPTDGLKVDWKAGTTSVSLRKSPFKDLIPMDAATVIAPPMGAVPVAVSASFFFWVQRHGEASIKQSATAVTDGAPIMASTVTACSITLASSAAVSTSIWASNHIGYAMEGAAASEAVRVFLQLE